MKKLMLKDNLIQQWKDMHKEASDQAILAAEAA